MPKGENMPNRKCRNLVKYSIFILALLTLTANYRPNYGPKAVHAQGERRDRDRLYSNGGQASDYTVQSTVSLAFPHWYDTDAFITSQGGGNYSAIAPRGTVSQNYYRVHKP